MTAAAEPRLGMRSRPMADRSLLQFAFPGLPPGWNASSSPWPKRTENKTPTARQERACAQADLQRSAYLLPMLILNVLA